MKGVALAMKRSGMTREQIYYVELRGYLGAVARQGEARHYTEAQLEHLERIGAGRRLGLRLDEAGAIANLKSTRDAAETDRLCRLALARVRQMKLDLAALDYILTVIFDSGVGEEAA